MVPPPREAPRELTPIVAAIDDWNRNWRLGVIFEARVGTGTLLVSAIDLDKADATPGLQQLRRSLLDYAASNKFRPAATLTPAQARSLWAASATPGQAPGQRTFDREFLVDVSTPAAPRAIAPPGYFSWIHNYNGVWPGRAKAHAGHLYRAGHTLFDTHRIVPQEPPAADFAWPATAIYPGMPVQFEDRSTNQPTTWSWTVEDGSPP